MSLFHTETIACPFCGAEAEQQIANSVAAARRPDLREAIVANTYQVIACDSCGKSFRINPVLTYFDVERGTWILVRPCADRPLWDTFERGALDIFNDSFGPEAPAAAQGVGKRLKARVTFGWTGLREKLLCEDYGIDDAALELLKLLLMRTTEAGNVTPDASLRLLGRSEDGKLGFGWVKDATEGADELIEVPPELLASIDRNAPEWASAMAELSNGPFVDAAKLLVETELPVPG